MIIKQKYLLMGLVIIVFVLSIFSYIHFSKDDKDVVIETRIESGGIVTTEPVLELSGVSSLLTMEQPAGVGVLKFSNGRVYIGELENGDAHGKGKVTYLGGASFEGQFSEGVPHGEGMCTYSSGESVQCEFIMGQRQ